MKIKSTRMIVLIVVVASICALLIYLQGSDHTANHIDKSVDVNQETGYSSDKNAVHELLVIQNKGKFGFADLKGQQAGEIKYDVISTADYGLYYVKEGTRQGFLNARQQPIFMTEETINTNVSEDYVIYTNEKKKGFINIRTGNKIEAEYEEAYDFSEGLAAVQKEGKIGFIDTAGKLVIPCKFYNKGLNYFKSGLCGVRAQDPEIPESHIHYIDKAGNVVIDDGFQYAMPFYEELAFVMKNGEWYVIDSQGSRKSGQSFGPYENKVPGRFKNGVATVLQNGKYGVIGTEGEFVIAPEYEELLELENEKIVFKQDGKYGYMKQSGKQIIEPQFALLSNFKNSVATFTADNKVGLISDKGKTVLPAQYEKIELLDNGIIKVFTDEKHYFYADEKGNKLWESEPERT